MLAALLCQVASPATSPTPQTGRGGRPISVPILGPDLAALWRQELEREALQRDDEDFFLLIE